MCSIAEAGGGGRSDGDDGARETVPVAGSSGAGGAGDGWAA
jgi:hypothetical protein